jgi:neurofibromin 1
MRSAIDGGVGSRRCEVIARTVAALSSINVRGRIFSKLRKVSLMVFILSICSIAI